MVALLRDRQYPVYDKNGKVLSVGDRVVAGDHTGTIVSLGPTFARVRVPDGRVLTKYPSRCVRLSS